MDKDLTVLGKFYLKNGIIIEDKIVYDKSNTREEVDKFMNDLKQGIKTAFKENITFQFTFGFTTIRGSELAAYQIIVEE